MTYIGIAIYLLIIIGGIVWQRRHNERVLLKPAEGGVDNVKNVFLKNISLTKNPWKTASILVFVVGFSYISLTAIQIARLKYVSLESSIYIILGFVYFVLWFFVRQKIRNALIVTVILQIILGVADVGGFVVKTGLLPAFFVTVLKAGFLYYLSLPLWKK